MCTADNLHCINPEVTRCGDGVQDEGEACDDGNLDNHDDCNFDCTLPRCGDGLIDGEEACDDGNTANGDRCSADCRSLEVCGDGITNNYTHVDDTGATVAPEECDEGGVDTDTCNADCTTAICGDGKVNAAHGELCDGGNATNRIAVDTATCNKDCSPATCGDTYVNAAALEECDNGKYCADGTTCTTNADCSGVLGDTDCIARDFDCCTRNCKNPLCGNGVLEPQCEGFPLETCDNGRFCANGNPCSSAAACTGIGDGECKTRSGVGAGCSADCLSTETCGDGVTNNYPPLNEICDDGKHCSDLTTPCKTNEDCASVTGGDGLCTARNGTGCSADCKSAEICGDGITNGYPLVDSEGAPRDSEVCDDGRQCADGTPCSSASECVGIGQGQCRPRDGDGCSADCLSEETCGDGIKNAYLHPMVNDRELCTPLLATCPAVFQGITTTGVAFPAPEACDDGNNDDGDGCSADCLSEEKCGDGYLNNYPPYNEICDDGNNAADDGCAPDCKSTEDCGNGITDPGEECDDGELLNGTDLSPNHCSATCRFISCGNERKDPGEQCDDGDPAIEGTTAPFNGDTGRCLADTCSCNICGDQKVNGVGSSADCPAPATRVEECDDGPNNTANCNYDCTLPECGDGIVNFTAGEFCDNGAGVIGGETAESVTCNTDCSLAFCGDGKLNRSRGEVCDDGNNTNGDGCSADCRSEEVCGDGTLNPYKVTVGSNPVVPAEICDLGSFCSDGTSCVSEAECSGLVDTTCVPRDGTGCSADCQSVEICGDSYLNYNETCDDGNALAGDGCDSDCIRESGWSCPTLGEPCFEVCGDGLVRGKESCDDGKQCADGSACVEDGDCTDASTCQTRAGDGCSDTCVLEAGWDCPTAGGVGGACSTICGDLRIRPGETCDDGDAEAGDGCSDSCQEETGWTCQGVLNGLGGPCTPNCGDGITRGLETCDDNDTDPGDGCDANCRTEIGWDCPAGGGTCTAVCGDFVIRGSENCDDGNTNPGDGCDENCQQEGAYACPTGNGFQVTLGGVCAPICGDGLVRGEEACDDGKKCDDGSSCSLDTDCPGSVNCRTRSGDGCDTGCRVETGWDCPINQGSNGAGGACTPTCGDGLVRGVETCDEGAATASGGCVSCAAQPGWACPAASGVGGVCTEICGDGMTVGTEECDDAGQNDNRADCTLTCHDATCSDNFQHVLGTGTETDVDCGGTDCGKCGPDKGCKVNGDCLSNYCQPIGGVCQVAPTPMLGDDSFVILETDADLVLDVAAELEANDSAFDATT
ncbi:MAG: DUF4215 domain-containing protein, partial [Myxococcales bacterium]|nr:DUF4215 domain-containing protein [Myxococcales bacterium]